MSQLEVGPRRSRSSSAVGILAFVICALATPALVFSALDDFGVENVDVGMDVIDVVQEALPGLAHEEAARTWDVAFLGDSMVVSYPPGRTVPERLEEAVRKSRGSRSRVEVLSFAAPGMGPFDYYLIADEVAAGAPDQVILPLNLASLSDPWRGTFSRPELAGWLSPARIPGALLLPLEWIGLTTDRMLLYIAFVRTGAAPFWHALVRQQARLGRARTLVAAGLEKRFGQTTLFRFGMARLGYSNSRNLVKAGKKKRLTTFGLRQRYGPALDGIAADDPSVRVLASTVRRFGNDGIRVLVYTNPVNIANMEDGGVFDEKGLAKTLDAIAKAVRQAGGEFADFHRLLPDNAFRDAAGHFNVRGQAPDGPKLLGEALAPLVFKEANAFGRRRAGGAR